jgi:hypothetical protein
MLGSKWVQSRVERDRLFDIDISATPYLVLGSVRTHWVKPGGTWNCEPRMPESASGKLQAHLAGHQRPFYAKSCEHDS